MRDDVKLTVDTLRYCEESGARCGECPSGVNENGVPNCHSQAHIADLIESLAAELEQVKQERDGLNILLAQAQSMLETRTRERDELVTFCHQLEARNDTLIAKEVLFDEAIAAGAKMQRERDAAVQDLNMCCPCEVCTRSCQYDKVNPYDECADFMWRGAKEE